MRIQPYLLALAFSGTVLANENVDPLAAAGAIDALIEKGYAAHGVTPNPEASDEVFVRRIYLDLAGRIPGSDETRAFLGSMDGDKRSKLIDTLLDSPGHVSHEYNFWADVLRVSSRVQGQDRTNSDAYTSWLKGAVRGNMPYDALVRSLVTAKGMVDENGAVGFYLRDQGMPLDHVATTVQVFLGTQMVCAQCHNHPFDEWTQMDYYKLASFSYGMDTLRQPPGLTEAIKVLSEKAAHPKMDKKAYAKLDRAAQEKMRREEQASQRAAGETRKKLARSMNELANNFRNAAFDEREKDLKLPHDYQYDDAKPNDTVAAATPFGKMVTVEEGQSPVEAYAAWMTSPENPRFTKVIANRLWKRVLGVGLFEPVDDLTENTEASNPELLAYLEKLMVDLGYDMKAYYRVLCNTRTYQREASDYDASSGDTFYYPGPRLRRMSAEQVWDSFVTLIRPGIGEVDAEAARSTFDPSSSARLAAWKRFETLTPEQLMKKQGELAAFTTRSKQQIDKIEARIEAVIKSGDAKAAVQAAREVLAFDDSSTREYATITMWDYDGMQGGYFRTPFKNQPRALVQRLKTAFPGTDFPRPEKERMAALQKKAQRGKTNQRNEDKFAREARSQKEAEQRMRQYVRASDIGAPAPEGHFLEVFGQSDRTLIENSSPDATVPQALNLMNGRFFQGLTDRYSALSKEVAAASDPDTAMDAIYLAMLSRKPTESERSILRAEMESQGNEAIPGILWAVMNTRQFLFIE
jgi:hypothetical protein